jgi:hypothetical protein
VGLSIERLEEESRACFLDIVLWREDEAISVDQFARAWRVRLPELSDGEIGRMLATFVSTNLLTMGNHPYVSRQYYRVHDVIRAAAIRMSDAEQPRERLAAPGGSFTEWPREWRTASVLRGCRFLSLRGCAQLQSLPGAQLRWLESMEYADLSHCESLTTLPAELRHWVVL